jgi:D-aminopeptidase
MLNQETMVIDKAEFSKALDKIFRPFNRSDSPGLVVGVAKGGELLYRRGFGLANVEHGVANTPKTRMRIGSTTKHFTCLASLLLAEDGKFDVDASIRTYIPELQPQAGEPTLRQLMSHAGGYRCYIDTGFIADGPAVHPAPAALAAQVRQTEANFPPGERMLYNNGGYNLLSLAIERVTGAPFESFLKERIFDPLGMIDTLSVPSDMEIHQGLAGLYTPGKDGAWRRGIFITEGLRGEGAMISTVDDMLRWLAHLRGPRTLGSASTWEQMMSPPRLANGFQAQYALGLILDAYRGVPVIHHGGSVTGGTCQMITVPDHALDIIILTNGAPANADDLANQIIDTALGDEILAPKVAPPETEPYAGLLGRYHCARSGMVLGLADMEGKLGFSFFTSPPAPIDECDEGLVSPFAKTVVGHFVIHTKGLDTQAVPETLEISDSGNPDTFTRLPDAAPDIETMAADLHGSFYARDIDGRARFERDGEALELHIHGPYGESVWAVEALGTDLLSCSFKGYRIPWVGVLNLIRTDGAVSGFTFTSRRTRNLRFERQD